MTAPISRRRLAPLLGLVLACVTGVAALAGVVWSPWSNTEYGVATSLPSEPDVKVQTGPGRRGVQAISEGEEGSAYMVRIDAFDQPPADRRAALNQIADKLGGADTGPLLSRQELTVDGYPAIDALTGPNPKGLYVRARLIAKDNLLVQLLIVRDTLPPVDRFYTDLKLTP